MKQILEDFLHDSRNNNIAIRCKTKVEVRSLCIFLDDMHFPNHVRNTYLYLYEHNFNFNMCPLDIGNDGGWDTVKENGLSSYNRDNYDIHLYKSIFYAEDKEFQTFRDRIESLK